MSDSEYEKPTLESYLLSRSDLRNLPKPEPLIENVLDQGTTAHLYGTWGTLKTFIGIDWGLCVATGKPWQGRAVQQRKVLHVVAEGAQGFQGRVDAWEVGWQTKVSDEWIRFLPIPVNLTNDDDVTELCHLIHNDGYSFIIIDTLSRCTVGADENNVKDMGLAVDAMTRMVRYTPEGRGVVLDVHHTGKDEKTSRGSVCIEAGADTVYFASRDEGIYSLTRKKRKDGPEHDHHVFQLDPIAGTESCVISASHGSNLGETYSKAEANLRLIMSQHFVSTGATATQLRQIAVDDGTMTRATFYRALSALVEKGWLINTGTDKRPFYMVDGLGDGDP